MTYEVAEIAARLGAWVADEPALPDIHDTRTLAFCRKRLEALADPRLLTRKVDLELGSREWRPLGRLLVVIAENDVLGTVAGFVAALLTKNRARIKARHTRSLLEGLKRAFDLTNDDCEILDWRGPGQDDGTLLADIDGVVLAGGAELIGHYRSVTPPGVRLIEFGPKLSAAALRPDPAVKPADIAALVERLIGDVTLFAQGVCSSPQFVLLEGRHYADAVQERLLARIGDLPPLAEGVRLGQRVKAQELSLRARLGENLKVDLDARTGWGVTRSEDFDPSRWLPRGFQLVVGPVHDTLDDVARRYPHELQTLGEAGLDPARSVRGFTHRCPIGRMHDRSPLAPHDGVLELASLVDFVSAERP